MTVTADRQPFCRCCGKAIRKWTKKHHFGSHFSSEDGNWTYHEARPVSAADAQRAAGNAKIISLRWSSPYETEKNDGVAYVEQATTWDGESYEDDLFCTMRCAADFGRGIARTTTYATDAYRDAVAKLAEKETQP
jgi:hypothetical protein